MALSTTLHLLYHRISLLSITKNKKYISIFFNLYVTTSQSTLHTHANHKKYTNISLLKTKESYSPKSRE